MNIHLRYYLLKKRLRRRFKPTAYEKASDELDKTVPNVSLFNHETDFAGPDAPWNRKDMKS